MRRWRKKLKAQQAKLAAFVVKASGCHCGTCGTWDPKFDPDRSCSRCGHSFRNSDRVWVRPIVIKEIQIIYPMQTRALEEMQAAEDKRVFDLMEAAY